MDAIPDVVRNKAEAVGANAWLESLPDLVAGLEHDWTSAAARSCSVD